MSAQHLTRADLEAIFVAVGAQLRADDLDELRDRLRILENWGLAWAQVKRAPLSFTLTELASASHPYTAQLGDKGAT